MKGLCKPFNQRAGDFLAGQHTKQIDMINIENVRQLAKTYSLPPSSLFYNIPYEVRTHVDKYIHDFVSCQEVKTRKCVKVMSDIGKRIRELREALGLTQKQFGERIGKSWRTVQDWEAGKSSIPDHTLRFISSTFGVSYEWLKEGKGEMWDRKVLVKELKDKTEETLESFTQIPVVRRSWTGFTMEVAGWGLVSKETILKGGQLAVQVKDDSMEPSLRNGDLVVFKLYTGDGSDIPSGKIVIVRGRNGELLVRRLVRIDAVMMLVSDNPKYPPILPEQIKVEEWRIIGVAVEAVKRIEL